MPSDIWTYKGEAGKALDATERPFLVEGAKFTNPQLDTEVIEWSVPLADLVAAGEILPEDKQVVSIYRNGTRFFRGHAMRPKRQGLSMQVRVAGPWWWMEKILLTTLVSLDAASGGGSGERATFGFPTQSMTTSLGALIDRAIALGVPMVKGSIATTFACIPITLNQGSCGKSLADLVRMIGDMAVSFDHSGAGLPIINIKRRLAGLGAGTCATVTLDARELEECEIEPQDDQRVSQVKVPFIDRAPNGLRRYQEQSAGVYEVGHVMILTGSGEELDTFMPVEQADSVQLQTLQTSAVPFYWLQFLNERDEVLKQLRQKYGEQWWGGNVVGYALGELDLATIDGIPWHTSTPSSTSVPQKFTGVTLGFKVNGVPITDVKHVVTNDVSVPDWLTEANGITVEDGEMTVDVILVIRAKNSSYTPPPGVVEFDGYAYNRENGADIYGSAYPRIFLYAYNANRAVKLINQPFYALTTVYRKQDYDFIKPPANFAAGLLAARNWTPYVGTLSWVEEEAGGQSYLDKVINVSNGDAAWAGMRAMVQSEELDLDSGKTTLRLGPPGRYAFQSLLDQVKQNPNQQIVYL